MNDHEAEQNAPKSPSTASTTSHHPATDLPPTEATAEPPTAAPPTQDSPGANSKTASKRGTKAKAEADTEESGERLQKLIAKAGIASRRAAEDLIREGRVSVNGHVITELGLRADPVRDRIIVDGHPLIIRGGAPTVVLLHKPKGYITTRDDPEKRDTVLTLLPVKYRHLHPIGRLDYDTSGVLLLTDDGELTHLLTHPSHGVEKVYHARVRGRVEELALKRLENGVMLDGQKTAPCRVRVRVQTEQNALVELTLREGRYRQVRRMLEAVGHPVSSLRRIRFDELDLEGLPSGAYRVLLPGEVTRLRRRVETKIKTRPSEPRTPPKAAPKTPHSKAALHAKPPARSKPVTKSKAITRAKPEEKARRSAQDPRAAGNPDAVERPATPRPKGPRPAPPLPEWKQRPVSRSTRNQRPESERSPRAPRAAGDTTRKPPAPRRDNDAPRRPASESTDSRAHPLSRRIQRKWDKGPGREE